jgi:hypothetical protein
MPVVAVFEVPGLTEEKYEHSVRGLTGGKARVESPSDWPVEGLLAHIAGQGESGFRVVDVSPLSDSNRRPLPYHGSALPTELRGQSAMFCRAFATLPRG